MPLEMLASVDVYIHDSALRTPQELFLRDRDIELLFNEILVLNR
jgi:hypothetical protein